MDVDGSDEIDLFEFRKLMRLFKFSRMLKVFKVLKLASSLNEWDDDPAVKVIKDLRRFTSLLLGVFFTAHYAACAFAYAAQGTTRGWSKSTWVADYFNGGELCRNQIFNPTSM